MSQKSKFEFKIRHRTYSQCSIDKIPQDQVQIFTNEKLNQGPSSNKSLNLITRKFSKSMVNGSPTKLSTILQESQLIFVKPKMIRFRTLRVRNGCKNLSVEPQESPTKQIEIMRPSPIEIEEENLKMRKKKRVQFNRVLQIHEYSTTNYEDPDDFQV